MRLTFIRKAAEYALIWLVLQSAPPYPVELDSAAADSLTSVSDCLVEEIRCRESR